MGAPYKMKPTDKINTFLSSPAYKIYLNFISYLCESVKGRVLRSDEQISDNMAKIVTILEELDSFITLIPLREKTMGRFGNLAYRDWNQKMSDNAEKYILSLFEPTVIENDIVQLLINYFKDSFGNPTRIDYGTGHEGAFAFLLCCLHKLNYFGENDGHLISLIVIKRYIQLVRNIQKTFTLEPAGSHGSWGLDDFQFLPYILGASQMITPTPKFSPNDILNKNICCQNKNDYLFLGCIDFINQVNF
uniref:Serine/threonine-protein phosphatase 2A activator n=1 Tax=Henneguya salminicola TaxID=69463 RepID=A0A6G3MF99_HENSL